MIGRYLIVTILAVGIVRDAYAQCQWYVQRDPDPRRTSAIFFVDSLHGWIGRIPTTTDALIRTVDGGNLWDTVFMDFPNGGISSISFIDTLHGWCVDPGLSQIYKSVDGGKTWIRWWLAPYYKLYPTFIQFVDSVHGFGVGDDTTYNRTRTWRTTDGGESWSSTTIQNASVSTYIQFLDSQNGWVAGLGLYHTTDGGMTWNKQSYDSATVGGLGGISFTDSLHGWACSHGSGWVIQTSDGGHTWTNTFQIQPQNQLTAENISFPDQHNGWVFGFTFYLGDIMELIYRTTDGGGTWFQESTGLCRWLGNGIAIDPCHAWAISAGDGSILALGQTTSVREDERAVPRTIDLSQNYPNPFNPATEIQYQLPSSGHVTLKVYNLVGQEVATLVNRYQQPGNKTVSFDGSGLSSGIYLYRLTAGTYTKVRKMVLLR